MLATVFGLSWKTIERRTYTLLWAFLFALSAINGLFNAFSSTIFPNREIYWIVVNAISLLLNWLAWAGFRLRAKRSINPIYMLAFLFTVFVLVIWFTAIQSHIGMQMMLIPCAGSLVMFACAWEISRTQKLTSYAEKAAIVVFCIYALAQFSAGIVALQQGSELNEYYLNLYLQLNYLLMPAAFTGLGLFTLLILVDDLGSRMKMLASTDQLTGVYNRRGFYERAQLLLEHNDSKDKRICVVAADLDHFKSVNDNFGHQMGDIALKRFTSLLPKFLRGYDLIGRLGGEEFVILLPDVSVEQAKIIIERLRQSVEEQEIAIGNMKCSFTASFGISELRNENKMIDKAMRRADKALYEAKETGRNKVVVFT